MQQFLTGFGLTLCRAGVRKRKPEELPGGNLHPDWPLPFLMPPPGSPLPTFSYCLLLPRVERFGFGIRVLSTEGERGTFLWGVGIWLESFCMCSLLFILVFLSKNANRPEIECISKCNRESEGIFSKYG